MNREAWHAAGHTVQRIIHDRVTELNELNKLNGKKTMTNLDSILKGRAITLLIKVCIFKAMVFPVVIC